MELGGGCNNHSNNGVQPSSSATHATHTLSGAAQLLQGRGQGDWRTTGGEEKAVATGVYARCLAIVCPELSMIMATAGLGHSSTQGRGSPLNSAKPTPGSDSTEPPPVVNSCSTPHTHLDTPTWKHIHLCTRAPLPTAASSGSWAVDSLAGAAVATGSGSDTGTQGTMPLERHLTTTSPHNNTHMRICPYAFQGHRHTYQQPTHAPPMTMA